MFESRIVEAPIKVKRAAKEPYLIKKGTLLKYKGEAMAVVQDEIVKPNNKFRYISLKPAPFRFYLTYFFRWSILQIKKSYYRTSIKLKFKFFQIKRKLFWA